MLAQKTTNPEVTVAIRKNDILFMAYSLVSVPGRQLSFGGVDHGLREGLRRFLGQVVADASGDQAMSVSAGEFAGIGFGADAARRWRRLRA